MTLPIRQIAIQERDWYSMNRDVWNNKFYDASGQYRGQTSQTQIRVRGGHTREYPKKSYEIVANGLTVHLNAEFDDPSMIRNALSFAFFRMIGVSSPKTGYCNLQVNGHDLGVYLEIEAVDRHFFRRRGSGYKSIIYATNDDATFGLISPETKKNKKSLFDGYRLMSGGSDERRKLVSFISRLNAYDGETLLQHIDSSFDIDNYLRWLAGVVLTGNYDGFNQNYALYRYARTNRYRIIPWDYEGTWGRDSYGKFFGSNPVPVKGRNELTRRLLSFKPIRLEYARKLAHIMESDFTVSRIEPAVERFFKEISSSIVKDRTRRHSISDFYSEPKFILNYVKERREIVSRAIAKLV